MAKLTAYLYPQTVTFTETLGGFSSYCSLSGQTQHHTKAQMADKMAAMTEAGWKFNFSL